VEIHQYAGSPETTIKMGPTIRPARAGDEPFLAWAMLSASRAHLKRGIWDLLIGADEAGCLDYLRRLAVAEPRSLCHSDSFWVAEYDGQPAAALCGFRFQDGGWTTVADALSGVQRDLLWTPADAAHSHKRMAPVWACFLPDVGADWGIENVATRPEFRGRGLSSALLNHALREGRERGCKLVQITTFIGNEAALSVYQKCRFRFSDEKRCTEVALALGTPGFVRLVREL
jgi:translation initiation factor 4G